MGETLYFEYCEKSGNDSGRDVCGIKGSPLATGAMIVCPMARLVEARATTSRAGRLVEIPPPSLGSYYHYLQH